MTDYLKKYDYTPDKDAIDRSLGIIAENVSKATSPEVLKLCRKSYRCRVPTALCL